MGIHISFVMHEVKHIPNVDKKINSDTFLSTESYTYASTFIVLVISEK